MSELYEKMINEALMAQKADVSTVKKYRGQEYKIEHTKSKSHIHQFIGKNSKIHRHLLRLGYLNYLNWGHLPYYIF